MHERVTAAQNAHLAAATHFRREPNSTTALRCAMTAARLSFVWASISREESDKWRAMVQEYNDQVRRFQREGR